MTQKIFNVVRFTPTPQGYAQRMKRVRSNKKVQTQLDLCKERFPLYSCHNCICADVANCFMSSLVLLDSSFLNSLQSFCQPSLDQTCFTCPILPLEEYSTKGFFSLLKNTYTIKG